MKFLNDTFKKIVKWLDPKLEPYRPPKKTYQPSSLAEFLEVIRRTPTSILDKTDRKRMAAVMSFEERKVREIMLDRQKMTFVNEADFLGPLTLDRLYKSGFADFPVVNEKEEIVGILHTEALNALTIRETDQAKNYLDTKIQYLGEEDSLEVMRESLVNGTSSYFLVRDAEGVVTGCVNVKMLLDFLLG